MVKDVAPCAQWGTKAPKGAWYQDEALGPYIGSASQAPASGRVIKAKKGICHK